AGRAAAGGGRTGGPPGPFGDTNASSMSLLERKDHLLGTLPPLLRGGGLRSPCARTRICSCPEDSPSCNPPGVGTRSVDSDREHRFIRRVGEAYRQPPKAVFDVRAEFRYTPRPARPARPARLAPAPPEFPPPVRNLFVSDPRDDKGGRR